MLHDFLLLCCYDWRHWAGRSITGHDTWVSAQVDQPLGLIPGYQRRSINHWSWYLGICAGPSTTGLDIWAQLNVIIVYTQWHITQPSPLTETQIDCGLRTLDYTGTQASYYWTSMICRPSEPVGCLSVSVLSLIILVIMMSTCTSTRFFAVPAEPIGKKFQTWTGRVCTVKKQQFTFRSVVTKHSPQVWTASTRHRNVRIHRSVSSHGYSFAVLKF